MEEEKTISKLQYLVVFKSKHVLWQRDPDCGPWIYTAHTATHRRLPSTGHKGTSVRIIWAQVLLRFGKGFGGHRWLESGQLGYFSQVALDFSLRQRLDPRVGRAAAQAQDVLSQQLILLWRLELERGIRHYRYWSLVSPIPSLFLPFALFIEYVVLI